MQKHSKNQKEKAAVAFKARFYLDFDHLVHRLVSLLSFPGQQWSLVGGDGDHAGAGLGARQ